MPQETATEEKIEAPVNEEESPKEPEEVSSETSGGELLSPGGIMMLIIAGMLDFSSAILAFTIILPKIIYVLGFIIIGGWQFFRSGTLPGKKKEKGMATALAKKFFKKQWKKLAVKAIPIFGDIVPLWTWTVYSELKG